MEGWDLLAAAAICLAASLTLVSSWPLVPPGHGPTSNLTTSSRGVVVEDMLNNKYF